MGYACVRSVSEIKDYLAGSSIVAFDIETAPEDKYRNVPGAALDPHMSKIAGISFSVAEGSGIYVPMRHRTGKNADVKEVEEFLVGFAADKSVIKVAHKLDFESMFFYHIGIVLQPPVYDTMAASQMTLKNHWQYRNLADSGLKKLARKQYGYNMPTYEDVTAGRAFDELNPEGTETVRYACADSDYALRLYHSINEWFDRCHPRHRFVVERIESPAAVYVGIMKNNGLLIDRQQMEEKEIEAEEAEKRLRREIFVMTGGVDIGANASTAAFRNYLYNHLKLPVLMLTKKGQSSTGEEALIRLSEWCKKSEPKHMKLFKLVHEYRKIGKIKSTYIKGYAKYISDATGCIHPDLFQLGAESGRFSCSNPNIQNMPSGIEINVRDLVIASKGCSLIELDYSQIEARLAAYLSRDEKLLNVYKEKKDLHAMTTSAVFQIPLSQAMDRHDPDYKHRRTVAKATFFGFLYGMYAKTLMQNLKKDADVDATFAECHRFLRNLALSYPTLARWQKKTIEKAQCRGYAETLSGRRRYLLNLRSNDFRKRGNAERSALNHGVQGLAADLLKLAMGRLIEVMPGYLKPLFTVHDSLVFECPDEKVPEAAALIKTAMETVPPIKGFDVEIIAEVSVGKSYGSMEEIE